MSCFHPRRGWRARSLNDSGKRSIVFNVKDGYVDMPVSVPCGGCVGCRLDYARQWAIRCVHEASLWPGNSFVTLTYNPEFLPPSGSLVKSDFQKFMKRLRKRFHGIKSTVDKNGKVIYPIRFFHCGEYGEQYGRPHYHVLLFNFFFSDRVFFRSVGGSSYFRSRSLEDLWSDPITGRSFGFSSIGDVNYATASYVARYILKKITGKLAPDVYQGRQDEYTLMSRRPGIASDWYDKFSSDVFPRDEVVLNGRTFPVPKYYDRRYELTNPEEYGILKGDRKRSAVSNPDNSPERLAVREKVAKANCERLSRSYEGGS